MTNRGQKLLLWTTPIGGLLLLIGFFNFPAMWPPLSPELTPEEVAAFYREHNSAMLGVVVMCNLLGTVLVPIFSTTAVHMMRIVNSSKVFAVTYIAAIAMAATAFIIADYCWGVALFRPDRDPQLISLLNDLGWIFFIAPVGPLIAMNLCLAGAIYLDARPDPVFPRWVAHFNVAAAILMIPAAFAVTTKTGPLAWDGSLSFTLRLATLAIYVGVMFVVLLGVINRQGDESAEMPA